MWPARRPARGSAASPRHLHSPAEAATAAQGARPSAPPQPAAAAEAGRRVRWRCPHRRRCAAPRQLLTAPLAARPPPAPRGSPHCPASAARRGPGSGPGAQGTCGGEHSGHSGGKPWCMLLLLGGPGHWRQDRAAARHISRSPIQPARRQPASTRLTCCWAAGCAGRLPPRAARHRPPGCSPPRRRPPSRQACRHPAPPPWAEG